LVFTFILLPSFSFAVTKFKEIQPGKTTKDEVSGILGEPMNEINSSTYEYLSPQTRIEKIVIEYKTAAPTPVADKIDVYFSKPVARSAQAKQMNLPESPTSQGESPEGKLQEYYGSTKSLILTYKGKTTESGIKTISFLSRERFESMSKEVAKKPEETKPTTPGEEQKKPKSTTPDKKSKKPTDTDTITSKQTEVAKLTPEAKQHLQQGMTYAALAQGNPKTASENYENASMEFSRAIELYPNYAEAYSNRGVAYMQQKKYNKALEDLKRRLN
jgi:Flp pilus assembly protein TadD, contains TPR repeats